MYICIYLYIPRHDLPVRDLRGCRRREFTDAADTGCSLRLSAAGGAPVASLLLLASPAAPVAGAPFDSPPERGGIRYGSVAVSGIEGIGMDPATEPIQHPQYNAIDMCSLSSTRNR